MNEPGSVRRYAEQDHQGVVDLVQELVRIPSRGGVDPYQPMLDAMREWFTSRGLPTRTLTAR